jgi:uncharacterized tellurite resistance protein B-like protein/GTPase Era involved in 16S rRNA processing
MDTSLVDSEAVDLLSHITGQKLSQQDLTPPVIFLTTLVTVLLGVIFADKQVTTQEEQRLQATLNKFIPPTGNVRQLTELMVKGVRENLDYTKPSKLLRLSPPLSKSERLLLICFGYEMSAADGAMDASKRRYLELIGDRLNINPRHLAVLEALFSHQETVDTAAWEEVQSLLDPSRFHELDTVFVNAASNILAAFSTQPEPQAIQQQSVASKVASDVPHAPTAQPETSAPQQPETTPYPELEKFQSYKKQLYNLCHQLFQIAQDSNNRALLPKSLTEEIAKVSHKLQSQRFRLSVIGEFSQGKSTLLNALLREEIQPVRAIPCSGTVTVLRYGTQKRVVCRYKDGREEEIRLYQYKEKAAIPKEAARDHRSNELEKADIDEIIFEHPDLELCKSGVEIIDSPGLNEHPERTAITQKLLNDTDAVIFLTNAMRLLPEKEKELIEDVRTQLNGGQENQPVENLFVLVNFMDLLDEEEDTQDVMQRIERFVKENNLLIAGEKRIYYISAKAALKAIVNGTDDKYLEAFQSFTKSIEKFLTIERGSLEIQQSVTKVKALIQSSLKGLHQAEDVLDGKLELSETERQNILEQIGEASGRDVKIQNLANQLKKQASQEAIEYWEQWKNGLGDRMAKKSEKWSSNHSPIFSQKKLIEDYINKCIEELKAEINAWGDKQLRDVILKRNLKILDDTIYRELESIKAELKSLDHQVKTHVSEQLDLAIHGINDDFIGDRAFLGGIGVGGAVAAALIFLTPLGWVAVITGSLAAAIVGEFGSGLVGFDGIRDQIKRKVCEMGVQKLKESPVDKKLNEIVSSVVDNRVESASQVIAQAISLCENLLEQQEKAHKETLEQREADKAWISQKRQELEQVQKNIEAVLNQSRV